MQFRRHYSITSVKDFYTFGYGAMPALGAIFVVVGLYMMVSIKVLYDRTEAAQVTVVKIESRQSTSSSGSGSKKTTKFRPTFAATSAEGQTITYVGSSWVSPKPHDEGDVVEGRVDWDTGEITSIKMLGIRRFAGKLFVALGGVALLVSLYGWWRHRQTKVDVI